MNGSWGRRSAVVGILAMAGAMLQWAIPSAALADQQCVLVLADDQGNAAARICAGAGLNSDGNPYAGASIIQDYKAEQGPEPLVIVKAGIVEGEDYPRSFSGGVKVDGIRVNFTVDMSGDPYRTTVCLLPGVVPDTCVSGDDFHLPT